MQKRNENLKEHLGEKPQETPVPVVVKRIASDESVKKLERDISVTREEQFNLDKIIEGAGTKFYVTGDTVKIGFYELLDLSTKHNIAQVQDANKEEVVVSSRLLTSIARAEVVDQEEQELQYVDAASVGIFIGAILFGLVGILLTDLEQLMTFSWILLIVGGVMLSSYTYQGMKSGFLRKLWRKYLAKMAKGGK